MPSILRKHCSSYYRRLEQATWTEQRHRAKNCQSRVIMRFSMRDFGLTLEVRVHELPYLATFCGVVTDT